MAREWIRSILPPTAGWEVEAVIEARYDAADAQRRYAAIQSAPCGGGVGSGRSRIGIRCRIRPCRQMATICSSAVRSRRSAITSTPRTCVVKGRASESSKTVKKAVRCSESP
jgi:hypothetical protein